MTKVPPPNIKGGPLPPAEPAKPAAKSPTGKGSSGAPAAAPQTAAKPAEAGKDSTPKPSGEAHAAEQKPGEPPRAAEAPKTDTPKGDTPRHAPESPKGEVVAHAQEKKGEQSAATQTTAQQTVTREAEKRAEGWVPTKAKPGTNEKGEPLAASHSPQTAEAGEPKAGTAGDAKETHAPEGGVSGGHPVATADAGQAQKKRELLKTKDGFETDMDPVQAALRRSDQAVSTQASQANAGLRSSKPTDPMAVLQDAKEPGFYWKEHGEGDPVDPELLAAVEECRRILEEQAVPGIDRVGPGTNEAGDPVVVVVGNRGFGEASLKRVPQMVRQFATLLSLPYDLLPLRRER